MNLALISQIKAQMKSDSTVIDSVLEVIGNVLTVKMIGSVYEWCHKHFEISGIVR